MNPNPSKDYVILKYNLEKQATGSINTEANFSIQIKDVTDKTIHTLTTTGKQDQITIVTENWKQGVYIATLLIDGNSSENAKFSLTYNSGTISGTFEFDAEHFITLAKL